MKDEEGRGVIHLWSDTEGMAHIQQNIYIVVPFDLSLTFEC